MGSYVQSLSKVDTAAGTFDAEIWMWSVCPDDKLQPLKGLEVVNGVKVESSLDSMSQSGGKWWSNRKIAGTFRQDFAVSNYPFDKQTLVISFEDGQYDSRSLKYVADSVDSKIDPAISLRNWDITSFRILAGDKTHPTAYGDPSLSGGESTYPRLDLEIGLRHQDEFGDFVKSTFVVYIAVLLALFSLLIIDGRAGLLGGTVFTVVLSFISLDRLVGPHTSMYLLDKIHFLALAVILAAGAWGGRSIRAVSMGADRAEIHRQDMIAASVLLVLFIVLNAVLIGVAVHSST